MCIPSQSPSSSQPLQQPACSRKYRKGKCWHLPRSQRNKSLTTNNRELAATDFNPAVLRSPTYSAGLTLKALYFSTRSRNDIFAESIDFSPSFSRSFRILRKSLFAFASLSATLLTLRLLPLESVNVTLAIHFSLALFS